MAGLEKLINRLATEYIMKLVPDQFNAENTVMSYSSWIVSQYAGDFNPLHIHDAQLSGVFFLKIPSGCLLYTSPSPRDGLLSRMPSSA